MSATDTDSELEQQPDPGAPPDTDEPLEPGTDDTDDTGDDLEPDEAEREPEQTGQGRCEAETTVGGNLYRCALETGHQDEHSFTAVELADPEADPPPPDEPEQTRIVNEQAKKMDRAFDTYSRKAVEILGPELAGFEVCPLCEPFYPGLRLPIPLTADTAAKLRVILGLPARDNFQQDRFSTTCIDCGGLGKVLTGSKVEQYATVTCLACKGRGWIPVGDERRVTHVADEPEGHREPEAEGEEQPDTDPWGRPKGDPDYGRLPGYTA